MKQIYTLGAAILFLIVKFTFAVGEYKFAYHDFIGRYFTPVADYIYAISCIHFNNK
jgi:hypothetical protein